MRRAPSDDATDDPRISEPEDHAAGLPAVARSLQHLLAQMGPVRGTRTLLKVNQKKGFDCPGCAWPEPDDRRHAEFCENGVKAVAEEATERRITTAFWDEHPLADLFTRSGYWLGQQGRLVEPVHKAAGDDRYRPISWDAALDLVAQRLRECGDPDRAAFYTSGRTSNEAAYCYQLLVRAFGTNNLPDCSNMCHESSGSALTETIGVGKGSVSLEDIHAAELVVVVGQNPGTNHPRMLSALAEAKRHGATVVTVNPLPEAGLIRFKDPQTAKGLLGHGDVLTDQFLQVRVNGDLALFQALGRRLLDSADTAFVEEHTSGYDAYAAHLRSTPDDLAAAGVSAHEVDELAQRFRESRRTVVCWAMGLTQHKNSVATIREVVNVLLLQGNIGKPGAGVCPVRGHSNVQGDRTMGIWERPTEQFLDRLQAEHGFDPPRRHGHDTVDTIRAMRAGEIDVFVAMGGNFVAASPDTHATEEGVRRTRLTVHVSTKLNRSHVVTGEEALILPTLGRTERDQPVSVEDSMSRVHLSQGHLEPASEHLLSEVAIVCRLGQRLSPELPWADYEKDYGKVREAIGRVVPGCEDYATRVVDGFTLPHPPRDSRTFPTPDGKARFTVNPLEVVEVPEGRLLLQTLRSHDQYNTTVYGNDDVYRGVRGGRRVVLVNPDDLRSLGIRSGEAVDLVSEWHDGERRAEGFRVVSYPTAKGCAAAYFPETNVLVPLDSQAETSGTPTSKSVVIRLERQAQD